ncbi:MAG: ABC transporter substrate-binding protein [Spirochaetes bacterium]|nr:ABC transporter substrate-binding protein [Spirochaetota bacterium]
MKKSVLFVAVLVASLVLGSTAVFAEREKQPDVFKFGFMSSLSGAFAAVAETQKEGALLVVEQINARGGLDMPWGKVKIETIVKDDEAKLDVGVRRFRELIEAGMNGMTGTCWNPMAAALNEETKLTPIPYLAACVPALDSFKKGNPAPGTFSVAFTPWSVGYLTGAVAIETLGAKRIFHVSRADSWGKTIYEGLMAACEEYGGEIIERHEYPQGTVDFTAAINRALAVQPDVFIADHFGADAIAEFKQAYDMGLYDVCPVFNTWITNVVATGIPEKALDGMYALEYFYWDMEGFEDKEVAKRAREYTAAYEKMWGYPPDAYATIAYIATELLFHAVEKAGTFDAAEVGRVLLESKDLTCVKGDVYFREDHQMVGKYLAYAVLGKAPGVRSGKWDLFEVTGYFGGESALPSLASLGY